MSKLVKKLENGTDFDVCIFLMNSGKWVVTIWDFVNRVHEKAGEFDSYSQALLSARKLNDSYKLDENTIKLTEGDIVNMVNETVNKMLNEGLFDFINMGEKKEKDKSSKKKNKKPKKSSESSIGHAMTDEKKTRIIDILKQDNIDKAPYAYKLWPEKDEDSARSYFYKCLNKELNDDGVPYSFSDKEFNRLYTMLSNMKSI